MPGRLEDAVEHLACSNRAFMKIVFFFDLCHLPTNLDRKRLFKHKADGSQTVCSFKWKLHVALVITIHHRLALVVLFQELKQGYRGVKFPVLNEMLNQNGQLH